MGNFSGVLKIVHVIICSTFVTNIEHCEQPSNVELRVKVSTGGFFISTLALLSECAFILT